VVRHTGEKASLTRCEYAKKFGYTLYPDNGGISGTGYWLTRLPCDSEVHSTVLFRRSSHRPPLTGLPSCSLLVLVNVFGY